MAHFIGYLQGSRGEASRLGTKKSGITASVNGWDFGIKVCLYHDETTGKDKATVYSTDGSNGYGKGKLIGIFEE